jgi:cell division protein FtsL
VPLCVSLKKSKGFIVRFLFWFILTVALLSSALAVIYSKYRTRLLFVEIQKQERELDKEAVKWGQLQLEITTLTAENRVEIEAHDKLKLVLPNRADIIYIKP